MNRKKLILFISGKEDAETRKTLLKEIEKMARDLGLELRLRYRVGDDFKEEILEDFRFKLLMMKKEIEKGKVMTRNYLRKVIISCIVDRLNSEKNVSLLSMENLNFENERGNVVRFEESLAIEEDKDLAVEAEDLFRMLINSLDDKDKDTLCYYLYKKLYGKEIEVGMSKSALYKRWERLRLKIVNSLPHKPSKEEFREFAERYLSEVCDKRGYKTEGA